MKHYSIPLFIPHEGCPHQCVFCNQRRITGLVTSVRPAEIKRILDFHLAGITRPYYVEAAFYGGSFTALPETVQQALLAPAAQEVRAGRIQAIRLSTRPDCIERENLLRLKAAGVKLVELGAQSFADEVLLASGRGHRAAATVRAAGLIREAGLALGLQLMPGLPGDTLAAMRRTLTAALALKPDVVRLYPTIVLRDTPLAPLWQRGTFVPLALAEAVRVTAVMKLAFERSGVRVIRTGLQSSPELDAGDAVLAGPYHPAFGELVEGFIFAALAEQLFAAAGELTGEVVLHHAPADTSKLRGQHNANLRHWQARYPAGRLRLAADGRAQELRLECGGQEWCGRRDELELLL